MFKANFLLIMGKKRVKQASRCGETACLPAGRANTHDLPAGRQAQNRVAHHMDYYVYVIKSIKFPYTYVGISDNPKRRIEQHNRGYNKTTKHYAPFRILLTEKYPNRNEARAREKYLKSGFGREYLKIF